MIDHSTPPSGVLVGVGGDPDTLHAVTWAAREAGRRHLPLDLVHVLPASPGAPPALRAPAGHAHALLDRARRTAVAIAPDVPVRLSSVDGLTGPALVAAGGRARLTVLGARPLGGLSGLSVGRAIAHVTSRAACPVVVVPPDRDGDRAEHGDVVVGADGSAEARSAVAFAADAADRAGVRLTVLGVFPRLGAPDEATGRRYLAEAEAGTSASHPDLVVREVVRRGEVADEIVDEARAGAAMIVLGSRGRGAAAGGLLGSTSQQTIRLAPCPVAVLSPSAAAAWAERERSYAGNGR